MGIIKAGRPSGRTKEHISEQIKQLEGVKRLNVVFNLNDYNDLKKICLEADMSISEFVRQSVLKSKDRLLSENK